MLTIKCDKCGKESGEPLDFENGSYFFYDANHDPDVAHLCRDCAATLQKSIDEAVICFLERPGISGWYPKAGLALYD
jgi:hypothetical protein